MANKPILYMLIGIPASGKSTWIKNHKHDAVIIDTDSYLDDVAYKAGLTYSNVFAAHSKAAEKAMYTKLAQAVKDRKDILWDQTNLTIKSRMKKLAMIPDDYDKIAVIFKNPDHDELRRRLDSRPGKDIPMPIIRNMINSYQPPHDSEGFDKVINV